MVRPKNLFLDHQCLCIALLGACEFTLRIIRRCKIIQGNCNIIGVRFRVRTKNPQTAMIQSLGRDVLTEGFQNCTESASILRYGEVISSHSAFA